MLAPMLAAYALYYWVKAVRWRFLLLPIRDATSHALFRPMMIGFFGNNVLPAHLGGAVVLLVLAVVVGVFARSK